MNDINERYGLKLSNSGQIADRECFPAQSSVLDSQALFHRVANQYEISRPMVCRFYSRGDSDIYRVYTNDDVYYLKIYRPPHNVAMADAEARLVAALHGQGVPVTRAVPRTDGSFATEIVASEGPRPVLLFEAAPPGRVDPTDRDDRKALGKAVAELHNAIDRVEADQPSHELVQCWQPGDNLKFAAPLMDQKDVAYLSALCDRICTELDALPRESPDYGYCHADLVLSNIRRAEDGTVTFFDFGNSRPTWRSLELAVLRESLVRQKGVEDPNQAWETVVDGYMDCRKLPTCFDEHLHLFAVARRATWVCNVMASCTLRMGTEDFSPAWVSSQLPHLRQLAESASLC